MGKTYFLIENGFSRQGVEDRSHGLPVHDRNRKVGRAAGAAERIAESNHQCLRKATLAVVNAHIRQLLLLLRDYRPMVDLMNS
jgi:hypothetical protein